MATYSQVQTRLEHILDERYAICSFPGLTEEQKRVNQAYYEGFAAAVTALGEWTRHDDGTHYVSLNSIESNFDEDEWVEWEEGD